MKLRNFDTLLESERHCTKLRQEILKHEICILNCIASSECNLTHADEGAQPYPIRNQDERECPKVC